MGELALFGGQAIPDHIKQFQDEHSNITERASVPSLSYEGKQWTTVVNGDRKTLMAKDADGEVVPANIMRVVIMDFAKRRGRTYYEGAYDPKAVGRPVCWSDDGLTPHETVAEKQSAKCDTCQWAVKGSSTSENGHPTTKCTQHRMIALLPANKLDFTPLRLKISITSDYDAQSPALAEQGWFAFSNYTDFLRKNGFTNTALFITKMKFDPNSTWPKVIFSADRFLEADETAMVKPLVGTDAITSLLSGTYTPAGVDGEVTPKKIAAPAGLPAARPKASQEEIEEAVFEEVTPPKKTVAAKPAEKPAEKKVATKPAEATVVNTPEMDEMLAQWP